VAFALAHPVAALAISTAHVMADMVASVVFMVIMLFPHFVAVAMDVMEVC
jgi:hypothetical protein